jgi:hypothetical protein
MMKVRMKIHILVLTFLQMIPEPTLVPPLPRWVFSTREEIGDLVGDPLD